MKDSESNEDTALVTTDDALLKRGICPVCQKDVGLPHPNVCTGCGSDLPPKLTVTRMPTFEPVELPRADETARAAAKAFVVLMFWVILAAPAFALATWIHSFTGLHPVHVEGFLYIVGIPYALVVGLLWKRFEPTRFTGWLTRERWQELDAKDDLPALDHEDSED